jgi:hypothetical protein
MRPPSTNVLYTAGRRAVQPRIFPMRSAWSPHALDVLRDALRRLAELLARLPDGLGHCFEVDDGRSFTWVERHMRTGMPHRKDTPTAWPMFRLSEVDAWLRSRGESWEVSAG